MENKKILITGADGFIGSHLIDSLLSIGLKNKIKVIRNKNKSTHIDSFNDRLTIVKGNLLDYDFCLKEFQDIDIVIHLAASKGNLSYNNENPATIFDLNARMDLNVIKASSKNNVQTLLYASTTALYDFKEGLIDESDPLCVSNKDPYLIPNYGYALSKYCIINDGL